MPQQRARSRPSPLPGSHPCPIAFLDETGSISADRFFAVGLLKLDHPSVLLRQIQNLRDRHRFYEELHWTELSARRYPIYRDALALAIASDARFSCFIADRSSYDPVTRFGNPWTAYERLAGQLLKGSIRRGELITVLADNYSTPAQVQFERDVKQEVNRQFRRLAVTNVVRLDSRSTDGLQLVDLLLGAVVFEHKQAAGLAGTTSQKARMSAEVRGLYGVPSFRPTALIQDKLNVACYSH